MIAPRLVFLRGLICFQLFAQNTLGIVTPLSKVGPLSQGRIMEQITSMFEGHKLSVIPRHLIKYSPESVILDNPLNPKSVAIKYSSIYWVAGEYSEKIFQKITEDIGPHTTYFPDSKWELALVDMHDSSKIELQKVERKEFSSKEILPEVLDGFIGSLPLGFELKKVDKKVAEDLYGIEVFESHGHIHPYGSVGDFLNDGLGYVIMKGGEYVGAATSVATAKQPFHEIEIQVDVAHKYRHQGFAKIVSAALIKEALQTGIVPHWDAANPESTKVALALGYKITESYFTYKINKP